MIKQLLYKWFGLSDVPCETCEVLRESLHRSEVERKELLHRLLDKDKVEPPQVSTEEFKPIVPQFTPWRMRQQMLEAEDAKKAALMKEKAKEIADLEKELGVAEAK
jgi:hypothetical protein